MRAEDPAVLDVLRRSMVARIATLSRNGRPSINPLYFVVQSGRIWLGTVEWTLAARNVRADPRVCVLFEVEREPGSHRVLRISGQARVLTEQAVLRSYHVRVARRYLLTPRGILNAVAHILQLPVMRRYRAQSTENGLPCVIEVIPLESVFLPDERPG